MSPNPGTACFHRGLPLGQPTTVMKVKIRARPWASSWIALLDNNLWWVNSLPGTGEERRFRPSLTQKSSQLGAEGAWEEVLCASGATKEKTNPSPTPDTCGFRTSRRGRQRMRWLDGITDMMIIMTHESEQTLGDSEGQGSLACCSPWGRKESDTTEQLNNNKIFNCYKASQLR